jgi:hypothetical protein
VQGTSRRSCDVSGLRSARRVLMGRHASITGVKGCAKAQASGNGWQETIGIAGHCAHSQSASTSFSTSRPGVSIMPSSRRIATSRQTGYALASPLLKPRLAIDHRSGAAVRSLPWMTAVDRRNLDPSHAPSRKLLLEVMSGFTSVVWAPTIPVISRAPRWNVAKFHAQFTITIRRFLKPIRK